MPDNNTPKSYRLTLWALVLYLALIYPLSGIFPDWVSFENGPVENLQVAVLLAGSLLCLSWRVRSKGNLRLVWLSGAILFFILAFRELSWGRVFTPLGCAANGEPIFMAAADMPYRTEIHACVGALALLALYLLVRFAPWKKIVRRRLLPWPQLLLCVIGMTLCTVGDHKAIFHTLRDQQLEEMGELLLYLSLCHGAWYYRRKLDGIQNEE